MSTRKRFYKFKDYYECDKCKEKLSYINEKTKYWETHVTAKCEKCKEEYCIYIEPWWSSEDED